MAIEVAETQLAVGEEAEHLKLLRKCTRLCVEFLGLRDVAGITLGSAGVTCTGYVVRGEANTGERV